MPTEGFPVPETVLRNGPFIARACPAAGGMVTSLEYREAGGPPVPLLVTPNGGLRFEKDPDGSVRPPRKPRAGIPVLLPFAWKDPENAVRQHGWLREIPWAAEEAGESSVLLSATVENADETLRTEWIRKYGAGFDVRFEMRIALDASGIGYRFRMENRGRGPFFAAPGLHPYFNVRSSDIGNVISDLGPLGIGNRDWNALDAVAFDAPDATAGFEAVFGGRRKFRVAFGGDVKKIVLWTVDGADFLCIEPWFGGFGAVGVPEERLEILPGAVSEISFTMGFEPVA